MLCLSLSDCEARQSAAHRAEVHLLLQVSVPLLQVQVVTQQVLVARALFIQVLLHLFHVVCVCFDV